MDRVKWIEAKGKRILYTDFSGLNTIEEQIAVLDEQKKIVNMVPGKFLGISNFTGAAGSSEFLDQLNKAGKEVFESKAEKQAILGLTGLKSILFQTYLRFTGTKTTKAFASEEEAIDYLVS